MGAPTLEEQMDDVPASWTPPAPSARRSPARSRAGRWHRCSRPPTPERTAALVLYATFARVTWAPDYDWAWTTEERDAYVAELLEHWGEGLVAGSIAPSVAGDPDMFSLGDSEAVLGEIEEFLTGTRHEREPDRMLATVLFTDIVDSTRRAAELGDRGWRSLLERHDELFRRALERHRGKEVKRTGDGFLATFDGPARAIRCATSVAGAMDSGGARSAPGSTRASSR
jgi:hypothetical protein